MKSLNALPRPAADDGPLMKSLLLNVPEEMRNLTQWVGWKFVPNTSGPKPRKIPIDPKSGNWAKSNDPSTWSTFAQAIERYKRDGLDGVGFVFSANDEYCGIDLDKCRDPATGTITKEAQDVIDGLDSYVELSPSGTGVHILVKAKPRAAAKVDWIEVYDQGRYFTMTGQMLETSPREIRQRQGAVDRLVASVRPAVAEAARPGESVAGTVTPLIDADLLKRLRESAQAVKVEKLHAGKWAEAEYQSQSEADFAYCAILAKAGAAEDQIDRIFRVSGLFRPKWDEKHGAETYGKMTLRKALSAAVDPHIAKLNERFAVVRVSGSARIMDTEPTTPDGFSPPALLRPGDFQLLTANLPHVPMGKKTLSMDKYWLASPQRREYKGMCFRPGIETPGYYNVWQGFTCEPAPGDWTTMRELIEKVICAGNLTLTDYVLRYVAHLFQRPAEIPRVALTMRGRQGTGKNTFVEAIGSVLGKHFIPVNRLEQITGRFNGHFAGALLIHANEAIWGGDKRGGGALKALITDATIPLERKNVDLCSIENYARIMISSNEKWPVPIEADNRRFLALDVSDVHLNDRPYFAKIHAELAHGGREAMLYDLLRMDISKFEVRELPPSPFGADIKIRSADTATRWWYEVLQSAMFDLYRYELGQDLSWDGIATKPVIKSSFHETYTWWCRQHGERHPEGNSQFFERLHALNPSTDFEYRPRKNEGNTIVTPGHTVAKRPRYIRLSAIDTARKEFEHAMNLADMIRWSED